MKPANRFGGPDSVPLMRIWCKFGEERHRAYIIMAIARRNQNEELTHNSEVVYRRVIRNKTDISRQYDELKSLIEGEPYTFRLYLTVNARSILDAYFRFQDELNGWSQDYIRGDDAAIEKMGDVGSRWISALHHPSVKDDSYFQFDLDDVTEEEATEFIHGLPDGTAKQWFQETPNGYHVISMPFNYTEWDPPVEYDSLDADGMVFLEECENDHRET